VKQDYGKGAARSTGVAEGREARSVLEQSSLDEFMVAAQLSGATFEAERRRGGVMPGPEGAPCIVFTKSCETIDAELRKAAALRAYVPIPWRPQWTEGMNGEELAMLEGKAFLAWRRALARMEEEQGLVMTPYEKNLDFWRQLWRCVERSDLLVQILDSRDPDFYRCQDLERYVQALPGKRHLLLINKADFLTPELRKRWAAYLSEKGVDCVFFSALRELHRQGRAPVQRTPVQRRAAGEEEEAKEGSEDEEGTEEQEAKEEEIAPHGDFLGDDLDVADCSRLVEELQARLPSEDGKKGVVGFVGYPNVGKSSVINALFGAKKVSMSRTPGKTKHLQTLELNELGLTLCDCPGLVFPSVCATKEHLVINGVVPIEELRDIFPPVRVVLERVGIERMMEKYEVTEAMMKDGVSRLGEAAAATDTCRRLCAGFATKRRHFLRHGVPDETWAARGFLRDYCTGSLVHCQEPAHVEPILGSNAGKAAPAAQAAPAAPAQASKLSGLPNVREPFQPPSRPAQADSERPHHKAPVADVAPEDDDDFADLDDFLQGSMGKKDPLDHGAKRTGKKVRTERGSQRPC